MKAEVVPPPSVREASIRVLPYSCEAHERRSVSAQWFVVVTESWLGRTILSVVVIFLVQATLSSAALAAAAASFQIDIPNLSKCVGVRSNSVVPGSPIVEQTCRSATAGQQYSAVHNPDGSVSFQVAGSRDCIGIANASLAYGAAAKLVSCGTGPAQEFVTVAQSSGNLELVNVNSSMCLSVTNQSTANGTPLIQRTCGDNHDQEYQVPASAFSSQPPVSTPASGAYAFSRTVNDRETGSYFTYAPPSVWFTDAVFGFIASGASSSWTSTEQSGVLPDTIYSPMVVAHIASPTAAFQSAYKFPYNSWLASQSACPSVLTGIYSGQSVWAAYEYQPDVYGWDPQWGINPGDACYLDWWANSYIYPYIVPGSQGPPSIQQPLYINLDGWAVNNLVYGTYLNNARVAPGSADLTLNAPLQSEAQLVAATDQFYSQILQQYPDICPIPHDASMTYDPSQYALAYGTYWKQAYAHACGILEEDILGSSSTGGNLWAYTPDLLWWTINDISWMGNDAPSVRPDGSKRIGLIRTHAVAGDVASLMTELMFYEIVKGPNFFFDPYVIGTGYAWDPSAYTAVWNALGNPTADYSVSTQTPGPALYSRSYQGGIVFLNWTGQTQIITLPTGKTYYDPSGASVTQITLSDKTGSYVTY